MDKTIPWTEKYRPQLFEDIILLCITHIHSYFDNK